MRLCSLRQATVSILLIKKVVSSIRARSLFSHVLTTRKRVKLKPLRLRGIKPYLVFRLISSDYEYQMSNSITSMLETSL